MHPRRGRRTLVRASAALATVLLLASGSVATSAAARADNGDLAALLTARLRNPALGRDVAMIVTDAATGAVLAQHRASSPHLPASNMKLVTAVTALTVLGADTRYSTKVRAGATPTDVVLQGGGDPLLRASELTALAKDTAKALTTAGTSPAPVTVHVDDSLFPTSPASTLAPGWKKAYIPSVVSPVTALGRLGDYSRDPSARTAAAFASALTAAGVPATVGAPATSEPTAATLATSTGHTVVQDVARMLLVSENNVAEVLFRQVALAAGQPATWAGGSTAARATLTRLGLPVDGLTLADGSGLSRDDRLTATFLADLLRYARVQHPTLYAPMFADGALPLAGVTGTLGPQDSRFVTPHATCAAGKARAKTGTLVDTIALSGIAQATVGERIFSFLVNHRPQSVPELRTRQAIDGLVATIVGCWGPKS